ncbi:methyltransferase domain-containing protein [Nocardia sp. NPDC052566]|uniref:methyltransferase domain-containing protein n=1 Tax=Nocardia sp. NPDC052566 TaxID=3364330 RepID=UPI0037CB312A
MAEYRAIFALSENDLHGRILDCPGGASSFTTEASDLGAQVTAADPIYARSADELRPLAISETDRGNSWATAHHDRYRWDWYGNPTGHRRMRHAAAVRFGVDLTIHPERYVPARLPALPFPDNSFDLVLSSHLLFTYADRLDTDFHLAALAELARVSTGETRLYPLVDHTGRNLGDLVEYLRNELHDKGIHTSLRKTGYEFHRGADTVLILR